MITRELAEKAMDRCATVCENTNNLADNFAANLLRNDEHYLEAMIETVMELGDIDELDNETRVYFIEDDDEYEAALVKHLENVNKRQKLLQRFAKIYNDLDD